MTSSEMSVIAFQLKFVRIKASLSGAQNTNLRYPIHNGKIRC